MSTNTTIRHKRSSVSGNVPDSDQIDVGELAINFPDQTLYTKDGEGQIIELCGHDSALVQDQIDSNATSYLKVGAFNQNLAGEMRYYQNTGYLSNDGKFRSTRIGTVYGFGIDEGASVIYGETPGGKFMVNDLGVMLEEADLIVRTPNSPTAKKGSARGFWEISGMSLLGDSATIGTMAVDSATIGTMAVDSASINKLAVDSASINKLTVGPDSADDSKLYFKTGLSTHVLEGREAGAVDMDAWMVQNTGSSIQRHNVAAGNGVFLSFSNQDIIYSEDAVNWNVSEATPASNESFRGAYYDGSKWVAVSVLGYGRDANVWTSTDNGVTWSTTPLTAQYYRKYVYANNTHMVIADETTYGDGQNQIGYSSDAVNWTFVNAPTNSNWTSIAYGTNNTWMALGSDGATAVSTDNGVTWSSATSLGTQGTSGWWSDIAYGNGVWVVVHSKNGTPSGAPHTHVGKYSTDNGATWNSMDMLFDKNNSYNGWNCVLFADGKFVAVSGTGLLSGRPTRQCYSYNGIDWVASNSSYDPNNTLWNAIAYGNGKFIVSGSAGGQKIMTLDHVAGTPGLFYDGSLVATRENLTPLIDKINELTDETGTGSHEVVLDASNCTSPEFTGGSGTESDPFTVDELQANFGDVEVHVATVRITGLVAGTVVYVQDLYSDTNGDRFTAGNRIADEDGVLTVNIAFNDNPQSPTAIQYNGRMRIGGNIYIDVYVGVYRDLEAGTVLAGPTNTEPAGPTEWKGAGGRTLTATYPLTISSDGYYFTDTIETNDNDTEVWLKWAGDPGSGEGIDGPDGETIRGSVTDGVGGAQFFQLTIQKEVSFVFQTFVDSDQPVGGQSESRVSTVYDVNSYVYPSGTTTGDSAQYAVNGGDWQDMPADSGGVSRSSSTHYMVEGDVFQLRHRNSSANSTASTFNFIAAGDSADWTTVTAPPEPTIMQPTIEAPAKNDAIDVSNTGPFVSSDFEMATGTDTHTASSWEMVNQEWIEQEGLSLVWGSTSAKGVAWNGSIFCAIGSSGKCATSPDGVTWTNQTGLKSATNQNSWESIVWDGNQFCAVGWYSSCATSPDGVTWTNQTGLAEVTAGAVRFHGITWNGSIFCAIGGYGDYRCATSPDGVTWTAQLGLDATVFSGRLYGITWNGSIFCAVGDSSAAFTSPDGVTWTKRDLKTSNHYTYDVVWNGKVFVAVGSRCSVSTDGVTWQRSYEFDTATNNYGAKAIAWNGLHFIVTGSSGNAATSTDGVSWSKQPELVEIVGSNTIYSLVYDGSKICGVGDRAYCVHFEETVVQSLDSDNSALTSWELPSDLDNDEYYEVRVKHHTASLNSEWSDLRRFKTEPPAGINWTYQPRLGVATLAANMQAIAWDGSQFCAVGRNVSGSKEARCATSPDGVTWTLQPSLLSAVGSVYMYSIVWNGSQFCAVGATGKCATSPDGVTWTDQPSLPSAVGTNYSMRSMAWDGNQFCAVGEGGKCATSPDGVTWTNQTSLSSAVTAADMRSIAWDGNQFCAVGLKGKCATSPDGVTWTAQSSLPTAVSDDNMLAITWNGSQFCAVGAYAKCATSPDGVTWTLQPSLADATGTTHAMLGIIWNGSQFCTVGGNGHCVTSPDGVTWTYQPSFASAVREDSMNAIAWDGNQFCAVGVAGKCATSP